MHSPNAHGSHSTFSSPIFSSLYVEIRQRLCVIQEYDHLWGIVSVWIRAMTRGALTFPPTPSGRSGYNTGKSGVIEVSHFIASVHRITLPKSNDEGSTIQQ